MCKKASNNYFLCLSQKYYVLECSQEFGKPSNFIYLILAAFAACQIGFG